MVPTPLIVLILVIAFLPAAIAYLVGWPARRLMNPLFAVLAIEVGLMLVVLTLAITRVQIVWLSWVFLAAAMLSVPMSLTMYRRAQIAARTREREIAERRARGG
jgi:hypothetical protein